MTILIGGVYLMDRSKEELLLNGWEFIGKNGSLEYFAKENEHGEILFVPVVNDKTIGYVQSHNKVVIKLLNDYISGK